MAIRVKKARLKRGIKSTLAPPKIKKKNATTLISLFILALSFLKMP